MIGRLARNAAYGLILIVVLLPLYWMFSTSLKSNKEITQDNTLVPHAPSLDNYRKLFVEKEFGSYLTNSIVVTGISVLVSLVLGSLGAYAIARFRLVLRLERRIGLALLTMRIVPAVVILVPVYLLILKLELLDTWLGLIIVYTALNLTFVVWMMESFFREIPVELEEAALVDGDSRLGALRKVVLPVAAPGLVATAIKFSEAVLAIEFRRTNGATLQAGPMYYLRDGLKSPALAWIYALLAGIGALTTTPFLGSWAGGIARCCTGTVGVPPMRGFERSTSG